MKQTKYLNGVLTVIASCLVLITFAITGILPTAFASKKPGGDERKFVTVPINADGSMNVKLVNQAIDVKIVSCSSSAFYLAEPIEVKVKN